MSVLVFFGHLRTRISGKECAEPEGVTRNSTSSSPNCYPYTVLTSGLLFPYDTWLNLVRYSFHCTAGSAPTNDTSACFRQHGEEICQMQETISIMNAPCYVCPNVRQMYAENLICLEGNPETCQKIILFWCKCFKHYVCCIFIYTYEIIYGYRILCLLTQ
jgi:hypothetical protein